MGLGGWALVRDREVVEGAAAPVDLVVAEEATVEAERVRQERDGVRGAGRLTTNLADVHAQPGVHVRALRQVRHDATLVVHVEPRGGRGDALHLPGTSLTDVRTADGDTVVHEQRAVVLAKQVDRTVGPLVVEADAVPVHAVDAGVHLERHSIDAGLVVRAVGPLLLEEVDPDLGGLTVLHPEAGVARLLDLHPVVEVPRGPDATRRLLPERANVLDGQRVQPGQRPALHQAAHLHRARRAARDTDRRRVRHTHLRHQLDVDLARNVALDQTALFERRPVRRPVDHGVDTIDHEIFGHGAGEVEVPHRPVARRIRAVAAVRLALIHHDVVAAPARVGIHVRRIAHAPLRHLVPDRAGELRAAVLGLALVRRIVRHLEGEAGAQVRDPDLLAALVDHDQLREEDRVVAQRRVLADPGVDRHPDAGLVDRLVVEDPRDLVIGHRRIHVRDRGGADAELRVAEDPRGVRVGEGETDLLEAQLLLARRGDVATGDDQAAARLDAARRQLTDVRVTRERCSVEAGSGRGVGGHRLLRALVDDERRRNVDDGRLLGWRMNVGARGNDGGDDTKAHRRHGLIGAQHKSPPRLLLLLGHPTITPRSPFVRGRGCSLSLAPPTNEDRERFHLSLDPKKIEYN